MGASANYGPARPSNWLRANIDQGAALSPRVIRAGRGGWLKEMGKLRRILLE